MEHWVVLVLPWVVPLLAALIVVGTQQPALVELARVEPAQILPAAAAETVAAAAGTVAAAAGTVAAAAGTVSAAVRTAAAVQTAAAAVQTAAAAVAVARGWQTTDSLCCCCCCCCFRFHLLF